MQWVESRDNPLHITQTEGEYLFDLQYQPAEYVYLQRINARDVSAQWDTAALKDIEGMQYYTLTIGLTDPRLDFLNHQVANPSQKGEKLYYFSYTFPQDIYLVDNNRKLPCELFHFERSYDLKPSRTFVLGFENPHKQSEEATLVVQSPWITDKPVSLRINKKDIPKVKL